MPSLEMLGKAGHRRALEFSHVFSETTLLEKSMSMAPTSHTLIVSIGHSLAVLCIAPHRARLPHLASRLLLSVVTLCWAFSALDPASHATTMDPFHLRARFGAGRTHHSVEVSWGHVRGVVAAPGAGGT